MKRENKIKMKILIIIPAYNEEKTIAEVVSGVLKYNDHILVIDDGSEDRTNDIINKFHVKIIKNEKKSGKGFSLRRGFAYAIENKYDAVITIDADGEHNPQYLSEINRLLYDGDIVIAQRVIYRSKIRSFLNKFSTFFIHFLLPNVKDTQSGYRAIRVDLLKKIHLTTNQFDTELEMLLEAVKNNARIQVLNINHNPQRKSNQTFIDFVRINNLFDRWYLINFKYLRLSLCKKYMLLCATFFGICIGGPLEVLLKKITKKH